MAVPLHRWDVSPAEAVGLQRKLAKRVRLSEPRGFRIDRPLVVAGADVSCARGSRTIRAAIVAVTLPEFELVAAERIEAECCFPYVPGLLSFREAPVVIQLVERLFARGGRFDCLIADGQGIAHPRRLGLASHLGLCLDLPTVGAAKSRLCGEHDAPSKSKGGFVPLILKERDVGCVLTTRAGVRPLYVSPGHRISIEGARAIVTAAVTRFRLPEPTRLAHRAAGFTGTDAELEAELRRMLKTARPAGTAK